MPYHMLNGKQNWKDAWHIWMNHNMEKDSVILNTIANEREREKRQNWPLHYMQ